MAVVGRQTTNSFHLFSKNAKGDAAGGFSGPTKGTFRVPALVLFALEEANQFPIRALSVTL